MNFALKWIGCVFVCLGAFCMSFRIDPLNIYFMNIGALLYLIWAIRIKERNLVVVNSVLLFLYILGLFQ